MNLLAFGTCTAAGSLAFGWVWARARGREGLPFLVFTGFYVLTTVIGASLLQFDPRLVELLLLGRGIDLRGMPPVAPWLYWGVLHLPLVLAALALPRGAAAPDGAGPSGSGPSLAAYLVALTGLTGFCVVSLASQGYRVSPGALLDLPGGYRDAIIQRAEMMSALGAGFFGVVYMGLPALSYLGLFAAARTRRPAWVVLTALTVAVTAWLSVVSVQKSIVLVYLVFLGLGAFLLGLVRWRFLLGLGGGLFALLTLMQVLVLGAFGAGQSVVHLLLRLGPAYPYYLGLFPGTYPYYGVDWQGTLFGREFTGSAPDYNLLVSGALYRAGPVQGASPIGAVASAYAEAGPWYAVVMAIVVVLLLRAAGRFGRGATGSPFRFAAYLQALTAAYYLTQVPLGATIWSSYGLKWGLLTLGIVWLLDYGLFRAPRPSPVRATVLPVPGEHHG